MIINASGPKADLFDIQGAKDVGKQSSMEEDSPLPKGINTSALETDNVMIKQSEELDFNNVEPEELVLQPYSP
jgi:hypothetical protein